MRSEFLLKADAIAFQQVEKCAAFVAKQIKKVILQGAQALFVDAEQTITGKELRESIVGSIQNYLPKSASHTKHVSLGAVLDKFVKLKDEHRVQEQDKPLLPIEENIRKHYESGADDIPDTTQLKNRVNKLHEAYAEVLKRRTTEEGRIKAWLHVVREGNNSFRKVYDNIWQEV